MAKATRYLLAMAQTFLHTLFGPGSRALQAAAGSRGSYARMEAGAGPADILTDRELDFIAARDSFYMASVSEDGWPYVQHRGGPTGFLRPIAGNRLGFADYRGNRQYLSTAHIAADDRVSLFLMDYPNRRRLKLIGHARSSEDPADIAALMPPDYLAEPERAFVIDVIGFDWNCPQHITPRFTEAEVRRGTQPLIDEIGRLRARIEQLEGERS
ncbi:pyridoxamine 5'-phosphate oxidase family protein [Novosphingobium sp. BL-52-GroH]|uniref:pyridoxamine 5'-phosphate oxidase family protein n=1 Tax=Novosphingobium sp. BL-52-GroH TaxID=3349877 RepID=UPI0038510B0E